MINEVRNTVMAILNKDNNGYVTPEEFNLFAKQAQLELFEEYFYDYKNALNLQNKRLSKFWLVFQFPPCPPPCDRYLFGFL